MTKAGLYSNNIFKWKHKLLRQSNFAHNFALQVFFELKFRLTLKDTHLLFLTLYYRIFNNNFINELHCYTGYHLTDVKYLRVCCLPQFSK